IRQLAALVRLRLMAVVGERVARDLRTQLYEHIQRLSLSFFARKKTGGLITRAASDTDRLWEFLAFGIVDVSLSLVMLLGLSAVLLSLDWRLGLLMTVPAPFFCWLIYRHGEAMTPLFLRTWRKWSRVTDVLGDTIPRVRVVKAFNQESREIGRFVVRNDDVTEEANRVFEVLDTEPDVRDPVAPVRLEPVRGRVTFDNVTFAYDGVRPVLRGVSFDIEPGELIGLVGPSGGG